MERSQRIHIGRIIEARINELRISKAEFARRIGTSKQNVNRILEKESMDTAVLTKYSEVLNYNFFNLYADEQQKIVKTEGDYSPASDSGDVSVIVGDAVLAERVKSLEALVAEKDERITELKERIEELKAK